MGRIGQCVLSYCVSLVLGCVSERGAIVCNEPRLSFPSRFFLVTHTPPLPLPLPLSLPLSLSLSLPLPLPPPSPSPSPSTSPILPPIPHFSEHYKSPVTRSFSTEQSLDPTKYSNLLMPSNIPVTPSFEDLASIASGRVSSTIGTENSSGSSESVEETFTATEMERTSQLPALRSHENPSPELWKRKQLDVKSKRKMFQSLRHSSGDVRLHNEEIDDDRIRFNVARTADVKEKGKFLMKVRQTGPDLTFGSHPAVDNERGEGWKRSSSSSAVIPESASEGDQVSNGAGSDLRPRHINKATGMTNELPTSL